MNHHEVLWVAVFLMFFCLQFCHDLSPRFIASEATKDGGVSIVSLWLGHCFFGVLEKKWRVVFLSLFAFEIIWNIELS